MGAATVPLSDDIIALGNEIGCSPKMQVGKRFPEVGHERLDISVAPARLVKRVLQEHVRRRYLIDDGEIADLAPEFIEPAANNGLITVFVRPNQNRRANSVLIQ